MLHRLLLLDAMELSTTYSFLNSYFIYFFGRRIVNYIATILKVDPSWPVHINRWNGNFDRAFGL
jgi:hypothetical protein